MIQPVHLRARLLHHLTIPARDKVGVVVAPTIQAITTINKEADVNTANFAKQREKQQRFSQWLWHTRQV